MPLVYGVKLRTGSEGELKSIRGGHYQFSVQFATEDGGDMIEIHGFRINQNLNRIIPPVSFAGRNQIVHIVEISREFEDKLIEIVRSQVDELNSFEKLGYSSD